MKEKTVSVETMRRSDAFSGDVKGIAAEAIEAINRRGSWGAYKQSDVQA